MLKAINDFFKRLFYPSIDELPETCKKVVTDVRVRPEVVVEPDRTRVYNKSVDVKPEKKEIVASYTSTPLKAAEEYISSAVPVTSTPVKKRKHRNKKKVVADNTADKVVDVKKDKDASK